VIYTCIVGILLVERADCCDEQHVPETGSEWQEQVICLMTNYTIPEQEFQVNIVAIVCPNAPISGGSNVCFILCIRRLKEVMSLSPFGPRVHP
jgi:hypothetical protein